MKWTSRIALGAAVAASLAAVTPAMADLKIGLAAEPYPPFASQDATGKWVGWEVDFADALCAAARRGVAVRVLIDGFGSPDFATTLQPRLAAAGVMALIYRPEVGRLRLRRHRLRRGGDRVAPS